MMWRLDEWLLPSVQEGKGAYHAQLLSEGDPLPQEPILCMSSALCEGLNALQRAGPHVVGLTLLVKEERLSDSTPWKLIVASAVPLGLGRLLSLLSGASA